jgi:tricorn protease
MTIETRRARWTSLAMLILVTVAAGAALADPAYVRQPDLHGDQLVFCAESDLWIAGVDGTEARRLTTHVGNESFPVFSPDGKWIAFSASYDGNNDVYVVSASGGQPQRLTWHPGGEAVIGWMPDGAKVIFRSMRASPVGGTHLFTVDLEGGDAEELPIGWASRIDIDPETGRWAFTRNNRENRPWKRYRGGWTSDIWVGDPDRADFRLVTDFEGMDHFPMWHGGRIWFLSDKGGTSNLWSMTPDGGDRTQHTKYDTWDIRWPALDDGGRIVFTKAADVYVFDTAANRATKIDIDLGSELNLTRTRYPDAGRSVSEFAITPEGDRLAVIARGEMFSVPTEEGVTLPISLTGGVRERSVVFDPKGEKVLYLTEKGIEEEMHAKDAWGRDEVEVVQKAKKGVWHYQPEYSPDGEKIAYSDNSYSLFVMDADGGGRHEVDRGTEEEIRSYEWSPDGRWLAYAKGLPNEFGSIYIYDSQEKQIHEVTGSYTFDWAPTWDPDGRYLYFLSDRQINPVLGELDFNVVEMKNDRVYMVLLRKDVENPLRELAGLPPVKDEEAEEDADKEEDGDEEAEETKDEETDAPKPIEIDFDGLQARVVELPIPMGRYRTLSATSTHLFYLSDPRRGMAESGDFFTPAPTANALMQYSLEDKESKEFVANIGSFQIAAKGAKMVIRKDGGLFVVATAAPPGPALAEGAVDLSGLVVELDPRQEWAQIYNESWRQMREFYWDEEMSGVDWDAIRKQYATLLPRLAARADLSDLISQVFGEMNTSHTYVMGGDAGVRVPRLANGLLGAELVRENDHAYEVKRILRGADPDRVVSPLDVPGVDIDEGDFVLAVNGKAIESDRPLLAYLENLAGKDVVLTVGDKPEMKNSREVVVTPIGHEGELRYAEWVRLNREYVLEKTDGKMGYIHVPDMMNRGMIEFNTWFYPQLDKEGMIVDMRWNGGGSFSQIMLERFRRELTSFSYYRGGAIGNYPDDVLNGPFVVLVNESSGSDGDIFPQAIQLEGLAPVIGSRTWGGVNGITGLRPLVDGGLVTQSQVAWWDRKDGWGLENRGVIPDIEIKTLPQDIARGLDTQLDRGLEELLRLHRDNPPQKPDFKESMRRSRDSYRRELRD